MSPQAQQMAVQNELQLRQPLEPHRNGAGSLVQDRPVLGRMPDASSRRAAFVLPLVDFVSSSLALAVVVAANGAKLVPVFPIGPVVLVALSFALGFYGPQANEKTLTGGGGVAWPALRALIAAALAWTASLLTELGPGSELALWAGFLVLDVAMRGAAAPLARRLRAPERWVVVGDEATTDRLNAYEPLREHAQIVCKVPPAEPPYSGPDRNSALEIVERHHADRVVIASSAYDDEGLNELIRTFRAVGVPVSLLPRPLDLLEAAPGRAERARRALPDRHRRALRGAQHHPLHRPRPPARSPRQAQRRRPGDQRGAEHRRGPAPPPGGPARGDPRRRQLP